MKKLLLILICLFVSFEVKSDDHHQWILVTKGKDYSEWYITDIKKIENEIHYWGLSNLTNGKSDKFKQKINCKTEEMTILQWEFYSEHFGQGEILEIMHYDQIKKDGRSVRYIDNNNTIDRSYYNYVCKQQ